MEDTAEELKEKAEQLYPYVMRFMKHNRKFNDIKQFLMEDGMDEPTATAVIVHVLILEKKKAKSLMKTGALIALVGIGISVLSYIVAPYNHYYIILRGPIIVGVIIALRGYSKSR